MYPLQRINRSKSSCKKLIIAVMPAVLSGLILPATPVGGAEFIPLPFLSGQEDLSSWPVAVSADGSVVVGSTNSSGFQTAWRWTEDGGIVELAPTFTGRSGATGVSADGSVIVGTTIDSNLSGEAFRWSVDTGIVGLGTLGRTSGAAAVAADGSTIVGSSLLNTPEDHAFRWTTTTGMVSIGDLPGGDVSAGARGVSADGSVIVGDSRSVVASLGGWGGEAFRWTQLDGMVGLGVGDRSYSRAYDVSDDGSVVVGELFGQPGSRMSEAAIWTQATGWTAIADGVAYGASSDGSTVVGGVTDEGAFIWNATDGTRLLQDILLDEGLASELEDWVLATAFGVSGDGRTIVGSMIRHNDATFQSVGFLVRLDSSTVPEPSAAILCGILITIPYVGARRFSTKSDR